MDCRWGKAKKAWWLMALFFASATRKEHIMYNITAVLWMTEEKKRRKVGTGCIETAEGQSEEDERKVLTSLNSR